MAQQLNENCVISRYKDPKLRTEFLPWYCKVVAYPSVGGIVLGYFTAVQLKQLNLSNLENAKPSQIPAEEDELSLVMMRQGAHWWPSWEFYSRHYHRLTQKHVPYDFHFPPRINVGYPSSGGVWVLKFSEDVMNWEEEGGIKPPYLPRMPPNWYGRINMALTGEDRCQILMQMGATWYERAEDCNDIPKTLKEGYLKGKKYEELLRKMDDKDYRERWVDYGITDT